MAPLTLGLLAAAILSLACAAPHQSRFHRTRHATESSFWDELKASLTPDHELPLEPQMLEIAEVLSSKFASLPHDTRGAVSLPLARSLAHHFLVQRHGWSVKGLAPSGDAKADFGPLLSLGGPLPGQSRSQFQIRLGKSGLVLKEVAALTAAIENLIHAEAVGQLRAAYTLLELDTEHVLGHEEALRVLHLYMGATIVGYNISQLKASQVPRFMATVESALPGWDVTQAVLRDTWDEVAPGLQALAFSHVARIAEVSSEQNLNKTMRQTCRDVKEQLVQLEAGHSAGRVKLDAVSASSIIPQASPWTRNSPQYLRELGALDESRPSQPHLIVPNYVRAGCLNVSSFYDACCEDECEGLLGRLEGILKVPRAKPGDVLGAVAALPSSTVPAPRILSASLMQHLDVVTQRHGGEVPLRGRLFAKWMHEAYPRECPSPQHSEARHQLSRQWLEAAGLKHWSEDKSVQIEKRQGKGKDAGKSSGARTALRACAFLAVVVVSILAMKSTVQKTLEALAIGKGKARAD